MIPLKLSLKNFLSYGQTTQYIDFEPYNLICLSGKNGHGKSALLDAITWALWGQARKTQGSARGDENLIRLGQSHMMVCLEFMSNSTIYRVRRELTLTSNKIQTTLDLGIIDPEKNQIKGLTDKTIRATQEKIITALGLDYESFINSVFLRQGSSNEFSKKSPKERKEILSSMLGITQFELIKKRAIEKGKTAATQKDTLLPIHERLSHDILQRESLERALQQTTLQEKLAEEKQTQLQQQLQRADTNLEHFKQDALELHNVAMALEKLRITWQKGVEELSEARAEFKKILTKRITRDHTSSSDLAELEKELDTIQHEEIQHLALQQEALKLEHALSQLASDIQTAHTLKMHTADMHRQHSESRLHLQQKQLTVINEKISVLQQTIEKKTVTLDRQNIFKKYEKHREYYQKFVTQKNNLLLAVQQYDQTVKRLSQKIAPACPMCQQPLQENKKKLICSEQQQRSSLAEHQLKRFQTVLPALKQTIIELHAQGEILKEAEHLEKQLQELIDEEKKLNAEYTQEKNSVEKAHQEKELLIKEQTLLLSNNIPYQDLLQKHHLLMQQLSLQKSLAERKLELIQKIKLRKSDNELNPETIQALLPHIKKRIHTLVAHLRSIKNERQELNQKIALLKEKNSQIPLLEESIAQIRRELNLCNQEINTLLRDTGSYKEQLTRLELQQKELNRVDVTIQDCTKSHELYQTIAHVLGKDGIQALLIEQAIPEIEQEANNLLEKLTDNQAHLFIESVRDLKSGKSKETLDIHISDAIGIRSYELFSGGEAFRIDFALRIALSKLLARRAGTSLQTLIIDEGFGSQDEEGLSHIMDALYKIQDDFAKIIIVSHLPYMKDQFPVHFVVHKTGQGSSIKIIEQG